ncbi:MAG: YIP1 family protein, partial [Gemmatimonadota bacterium]|nr:YIP1 family protein [Gemmatimonadota bacterium]
VTPGEQTVAPYVWLFFFLSPFTGLLALLINSSLTQIGVRMFVKNAQPIHVTARVMCYAAATSVLSIIPWVGWLAAGIWSVVLMVVGIQGAHGTSAGRAAAAVFVPIILITVALALLFIVLAMVMALAIGAGA